MVHFPAYVPKCRQIARKCPKTGRYQPPVVEVPVVVGGAVVPEVVDGLNGRPAQYFVRASEILRRVSALRCLPTLAAAILSFCGCGISLRQILFAIVWLVITLLSPCRCGCYYRLGCNNKYTSTAKKSKRGRKFTRATVGAGIVRAGGLRVEVGTTGGAGRGVSIAPASARVTPTTTKKNENRENATRVTRPRVKTSDISYISEILRRIDCRTSAVVGLPRITQN